MNTRNTSRFASLAPLAAAAALAPLTALATGCVISRARTEYAGAYISPQTVRQIEPGETQASVLDLLGPPSSKFDLEGSAERWSWRWSKLRRSSDRVLLLSSSRQEVKETGAVWVEFQHGLVTAAWGQ